jgi:hypothetical protein
VSKPFVQRARPMPTDGEERFLHFAREYVNSLAGQDIIYL